MNVAILMVEGPQELLGSIRSALSLEVRRTWKKGDARRRRGHHSSDGFSAELADVSSSAEMLAAIRGFLDLCQERGIAFASLGLSAELSLGVTVGSSAQYVSSVTFSASDCQLLDRLGITLNISAYPTSDEVNE